MWCNQISNVEKILRWISDHLSEVWLFSTAVFLLYRPAFPERLQNGICIAGLMSVASALVRLKKIDQRLEELRATQLLDEGRKQAKLKKKL